MLTIRDDLAQDFKFNYTMNDESIASILISALVDKLEGSLSTHFEEYNHFEVVFEEQYRRLTRIVVFLILMYEGVR